MAFVKPKNFLLNSKNGSGFLNLLFWLMHPTAKDMIQTGFPLLPSKLNKAYRELPAFQEAVLNKQCHSLTKTQQSAKHNITAEHSSQIDDNEDAEIGTWTNDDKTPVKYNGIAMDFEKFTEKTLSRIRKLNIPSQASAEKKVQELNDSLPRFEPFFDSADSCRDLRSLLGSRTDPRTRDNQDIHVGHAKNRETSKKYLPGRVRGSPEPSFYINDAQGQVLALFLLGDSAHLNYPSNHLIFGEQQNTKVGQHQQPSDLLHGLQLLVIGSGGRESAEEENELEGDLEGNSKDFTSISSIRSATELRQTGIHFRNGKGMGIRGIKFTTSVLCAVPLLYIL
ncbi:hypothetical protein LguiA_002095 [Lonicera macranthoides]